MAFAFFERKNNLFPINLQKTSNPAFPAVRNNFCYYEIVTLDVFSNKWLLLVKITSASWLYCHDCPVTTIPTGLLITVSWLSHPGCPRLSSHPDLIMAVFFLAVLSRLSCRDDHSQCSFLTVLLVWQLWQSYCRLQPLLSSHGCPISVSLLKYQVVKRIFCLYCEEFLCNLWNYSTVCTLFWPMYVHTVTTCSLYQCANRKASIARKICTFAVSWMDMISRSRPLQDDLWIM